MSDKHLPVPICGKRIPQLDFFEQLDPQDKNYSQAIELYDLIPKHLYGRVKSFDSKNLTVNKSFSIRGKDFALRIHGAIIKDHEGVATIRYPGTREELIEDALRKITVSNFRGRYDDDGSFCQFTIYELQQELKDMGHYFSNTEIKRALTILHNTRIELEGDSGKKVTSGYLLPSLTFISKEDLRLDTNAKCTVRFHEIVSASIKALEFHQFNYAMAMSFKSAFARRLFKRLSLRWRQASLMDDYGPVRLTTLLRDAGEALSPRMSNNRAKVKKAFDELVAKGVLRDYQERTIKQDRKIVEVEYTLQTGMDSYDGQMNAGFVSDQKRASHFRSKQLESLAKNP